MKVLAIGGCGEMGRNAVKTLLAQNFCEKVIIADINEESARHFATECGPLASWAKVDVSDTDSLRKAMADVDVVMNTVGPYYRFGVKVLNACIESGCHYFDINDDWEPTLDMLKLHERAKEAGITAVIGMGATPGISNMLAVKAIAELDTVKEIYTGWDLDSAKPEKIVKYPSAATVHGVHQLTGLIRTYQDGKYSDTKPIRKIKLNYPGIGRHSVWTIGHPEAVTLPRYFSTLQSSNNVMTTSRLNVFGIRIISWLVNTGIISVQTAARLFEKVEGPSDPKRVENMLRKINDGSHSGLPPLFVLVNGTRNGEPATVGSMLLSAPAGGMGGITGVPLAVGVSLLGKNKINGHGAFAPEGIINPDDFFNILAPLCTPQKNDVSDLVLTTRSWEK